MIPIVSFNNLRVEEAPQLSSNRKHVTIKASTHIKKQGSYRLSVEVTIKDSSASKYYVALSKGMTFNCKCYLSQKEMPIPSKFGGTLRHINGQEAFLPWYFFTVVPRTIRKIRPPRKKRSTTSIPMAT